MKKFKNKKGYGFVDSGVKILIAIVIGSLLLGGTYTLTKDTVLPTVKSKVESLFDYSGGGSAQISKNTISFSITGLGTFTAEKGMTWHEYANSQYNLESKLITPEDNPWISEPIGSVNGAPIIFDGMRPLETSDGGVYSHHQIIDGAEYLLYFN